MSDFRPLLEKFLEKSQVLTGLSDSEKEDYADILEESLLQRIAVVVIEESSQEEVDRWLRALREGQEMPTLPPKIQKKVFEEVEVFFDQLITTVRDFYHTMEEELKS